MSALLAPAVGDDGAATRARSSSNLLRSGMGTMRGQSPVKAVPTSKLVEAAKKQFLDRIRVTFQFFGTLGIHVYGAADARFADGGLLLVGDQEVVITIEYDELADMTTEGEERYKDQYQRVKQQAKSSGNSLAMTGSMPNLLSDGGMRGPSGVMG
ncbi:hypothetical protein BCR44DRAFT_1502438 [Catenaria anguillulae PL171]|uniref:Uncharacterized protein n=1 Tax=Catenaria anguillulae PL171 TaxID=765915 RepID=A0A1Y2HBE7_9FUNG|nr:hypothetical protein BCR44DRAFT_1502438 [Catenaria anguillulae PL171]